MIKVWASEVRASLKKYFDMADEEQDILIRRRNDKNVVLISEKRYMELIKKDTKG